MRRRIILASPREPSGVTWLINALLELGVCCYRVRRSATWERRGDREVLRDTILRRWLPAAERHPQGFRFRPDVEVVWSHRWPSDYRGDWARLPSERAPLSGALLFIRDGRDALYSRWRREGLGDVGYAEYARGREPRSLLPRAQSWGAFAESWLAVGARPLRFEDYKTNDVQTLEAALALLGLRFPRAAVEAAAAESTFDKAAAAEKRFLKQHPEHADEVINRGGQVGSWRQLTGDDGEIADELVASAQSVLVRLGYESGGAAPAHPDSTRAFTAPSGVPARIAVLADLPAGRPAPTRNELHVFARTLDASRVSRLDRDARERTALVCHLRDVLGAPKDVDWRALIAAAGGLEAEHYVAELRRSPSLEALRRVPLRALGRRVVLAVGRRVRGAVAQSPGD